MNLSKLPPESVESFRATAHAILTRRGGSDSASSLQQEMRDAGWRISGSLVDFIDSLETLGFRAEFIFSKRNPQSVRQTIIHIAGLLAVKDDKE